MSLPDDELTLPWRARYYEVDQQGVVFNSWYLAWFDEALLVFLTRRGLDNAVLTAAGIDYQLVRSEIDWRTGVRFDEAVARDGTGKIPVPDLLRTALLGPEGAV